MHWFRLTISFCLLITCWIAPSLLRGQDAPKSPEKPPAEQSEKIRGWIKDLHSNSFVQREAAMQQLVSAGQSAIEPVLRSLPEADLEVIARGIHVLRQLALSNDGQTESQAVAALETLASRPASKLSRRAAAAIKSLDELREAQATEHLQRLGGDFGMDTINAGVAVFTGIPTLTIAADWKGSAKDLEHLQWLREVTFLVLQNEKVTDEYLQQVAKMRRLQYLVIKHAKITDQGIRELKSLENLRRITVMYSPIGNGSIEHLQAHKKIEQIKLYGTAITKPAANRLQEALADADIDYRAGAFLGVGCDLHPEGCQITVVHPTSAARRADLRVGDVIVKYEGKPAKDFDNLTALIGANRPDETVTLEILRRDETLTKKIKLGEWD